MSETETETVKKPKSLTERCLEVQRHQQHIEAAVDFLQDSRTCPLPWEFRDSLLRYLEDRIETGGFLRHCLENDFQQAALRAGATLRLHDLRNIALALCFFPADAWGSRAKVTDWLAAPQEGHG